MTAEEKGRRVLVVDDDDQVCLVLEAILSGAGYAVRCACSAESARLLLKREPLPDVVLCDLDMPGEGGEQLCPWIQEQLGIPVVLVSGRHGVEEVAKRLHAAGVVQKPALPALLLQAVERAIRR